MTPTDYKKRLRVNFIISRLMPAMKAAGLLPTAADLQKKTGLPMSTITLAMTGLPVTMADTEIIWKAVNAETRFARNYLLLQGGVK